MSRRGREGAPTDEQLLAALDRLVEVDGIVKASERLRVSYRTASNCHESRHISRRMSEAVARLRHEQREQVICAVPDESTTPRVVGHRSLKKSCAREMELPLCDLSCAKRQSGRRPNRTTARIAAPIRRTWISAISTHAAALGAVLDLASVQALVPTRPKRERSERARDQSHRFGGGSAE